MRPAARYLARICASLASALIAATPLPLAAQGYPVKPVKIIMPFPLDGLDASSEQGSRLRDANVRESAAAAVLVAQASVPNDKYPNRAIRIVMPFPPGGTNDLVARAVGDRLTPVLKQPVVVDNRSGAGGMIGTDAVAKAAPDGYTLLVANTGSLAAGSSLRAKLPYDVLRDFVPISLLADITIALALHPSVPAKTPRELIALAKARPGKLNAAVPGLGTLQHLVTEWFCLRAGVKIELVPYKGGAPALLELLAGQDDMAFINVPTLLEFIKAGRLRAIAVVDARRSEVLPDVPTLNESGLPGLVASPWIAMMAPAATPKEIVARLNTEVVKIMKSPDMKQYLAGQGANPLWSTPDEARVFIRDEIDKWTKVTREAGIKPE
jgi:tripartite-type tricarboxylate transporter receptor subunit TctC